MVLTVELLSYCSSGRDDRRVLGKSVNVYDCAI